MAGSDVKEILLRLPADIAARVDESAVKSRRSRNAELIVLIERALENTTAEEGKP